MNRERLVERFIRYVRCASESGSERNFCLMLEQELKALGLNVMRGEVGEQCGSDGFNLYAVLPENGEGHGEPVLFSSHMDTVVPGKDIKPVIDGGIIRSDGTTVLGSDDKSGIAAVMEALETIVEKGLPHRTVEVMFTVCEEVGLRGSRYADYSWIKSKSAVVLDSSAVGCVINRAPANFRINIEITGKSAHAGLAPHEGIHALKAACEAIAEIPCGFVDDMTVMNVANLVSVGKTNIVPEKATFSMEIRSFDEELLQKRLFDSEQAVKRACEKYGASYKWMPERHSEVIYIREDAPIMQELLGIYAALGRTPDIERTYGGSDATWLCSNGIAALNVGTGMQAVHSLDEHIAISDLEDTAEMVLLMMKGK